MARTDTPGSMNFFGLRGAFGRGGVKPSSSSSSYPRSNVRITKAPPTRPTVKATVPKPAPVKPKTSVKVAERAKVVKPSKAVKPVKPANRNYVVAVERRASVDESGRVTWSKAKKTKIPTGGSSSVAKPVVKTSSKKKIK